MAFWSRLRQSKRMLHEFSNEIKRFYYSNRGPVIANQHTSPGTVVRILNNPKFMVQDSQLELFRQVRFIKRRKSTPKKQVEEPKEPRVNEEIEASMVRLVTEEGHDVIPFRNAMALAERLNMDLVEVDRQGNLPVCKIYDHKKQRYLQQTKERERAKSKTEVKKGPPKEVRFTSKIKDNDLKIKADQARRLMESGYRVRCVATDPVEGADVKSLLSRFSALIEDIAVVETQPTVEKTQAFILVRHVKFGPAKKGPGKKAKDALSSLTGETADDSAHSDEDVQTNESEMAVSDGLDDGHPIFDEEISDSTPEHAVGPAPTNTAPAINNRYAKDPKSARPPGIFPDMNSPAPAINNRYARDPKSARPPGILPDMNWRGPIQANEPKVGIPTDLNRRGPMQGNQPKVGINAPKQVELPDFGVPKSDPSHSSTPKSQPKSYGIFSTPKANTITPSEQIKPAASNRYKANTPSDPAQSPRPSPQRGPPPADSRMNRGPGFDSSREGRW